MKKKDIKVIYVDKYYKENNHHIPFIYLHKNRVIMFIMIPIKEDLEGKTKRDCINIINNIYSKQYIVSGVEINQNRFSKEVCNGEVESNGRVNIYEKDIVISSDKSNHKTEDIYNKNKNLGIICEEILFKIYKYHRNKGDFSAIVEGQTVIFKCIDVHCQNICVGDIDSIKINFSGYMKVTPINYKFMLPSNLGENEMVLKFISKGANKKEALAINHFNVEPISEGSHLSNYSMCINNENKDKLLYCIASNEMLEKRGKLSRVRWYDNETFGGVVRKGELEFELMYKMNLVCEDSCLSVMG